MTLIQKLEANRQALGIPDRKPKLKPTDWESCTALAESLKTKALAEKPKTSE